jgi:phosphonate transport system substrate-binding protein
VHAARPLVIGAVAYDPKVVTIWEGFKEHLARRGLEIDFVLFSNYEAQVVAHLAGQIDLGWNSPLAWVRARRLAAADGRKVWPLVMRDTDRGCTSRILVRADDPAKVLTDLRGRRVGVGAVDSPQATLIPLLHLRDAGLDPDVELEVVLHDVFAGKHGDHGTAERLALRALVAGEIDAACVLAGTEVAAEAEGDVPHGVIRTLSETSAFDHCNFTVTPEAPGPEVARFGELLQAMDYDDPDVRSLCELEGLRSWEPGRTEGYELLERAVDASGFYDEAGRITARRYRF